MNFQFAIIFGYDYEGEHSESIQLFNQLEQVDSIIEEAMKDWSFDYYMIGEIQSNGKINYSKRVDI